MILESNLVAGKNNRFKTEYTVEHLCKMHYQSLQKAKKGTPETKKQERLWTPAQLQEDPSRECRILKASPATCKLSVRVTDPRLKGEHDVQYERELNATVWTLSSRNRTG